MKYPFFVFRNCRHTLMQSYGKFFQCHIICHSVFSNITPYLLICIHTNFLSFKSIFYDMCINFNYIPQFSNMHHAFSLLSIITRLIFFVSNKTSPLLSFLHFTRIKIFSFCLLLYYLSSLFSLHSYPLMPLMGMITVFSAIILIIQLYV